MQTGIASISSGFTRHREWIGKSVFELVIVFIGVTAAFALENMRQDAADAKYRMEMIAALRPTLDDVIRHNPELDRSVVPGLSAFVAAKAAGRQPALPFFRKTNSERPPTRAWDRLIALGAARSIESNLFFRLALLYTRLDSFGEKYVRYNDFTEQHVFTEGRDASAFYAPASGRLKPAFAYVDRLRDLQAFNQRITRQAVELRDEHANARQPSMGKGRERNKAGWSVNATWQAAHRGNVG